MVTLWETHPRQGAGYQVTSRGAAELWDRELEELTGLALSRPWQPVLSRDSELLNLAGAKVSAEFFTLLGVDPMIGRGFAPSDSDPGAPPVVVLSHRLWRQRFGGDEALVGEQIQLEESPGRLSATVAGVLPPNLRIAGPLMSEPTDIFAPLVDVEPLAAAPPSHLGQRYFRVVGRLEADADIETARARLAAIAQRLAERHPDTHQDWGATMERVSEQLTAPIRPALLVLLAGVGLAFAVACCNVGILLASQARTRRRELAVRLALGASFWRVGRQILTECLVLATASGAAGLWLANHGLALLAAYVSEAQQRSQIIAIDHRAILFGCGLSLLTVLLFGLAPAIRLARPDLRAMLGTRSHDFHRAGTGPRHVLIMAELALASLLLVAASLLISSFLRLAATDPGFDPEGVTALRLRAVKPAGGSQPGGENLYLTLATEANVMPGVDAAGVINRPPLLGAGMSTWAAPASRPEDRLRVEFRGVSSGYFAAMGIPIEGPHDLARLDRDGGRQPIAVVSESTARRLWPGMPARGQRLILEWGRGENREVVGVVGDVRHPGAPATVQPTVYLPLKQTPHRSATLVLRGGPESNTSATVKARARQLGMTMVVEEPRSLSQVVRASVAEPRARALLVAGFALTAVLLAAGGTFSVVSYSVEQRRFESSVQQALGAHPRLLVRGTMVRMLRHALPGIVLGLATSLLVTRMLSGLLYGVNSRDPRIMAATALTMTMVVTLASYLPARKLVRGNPADALRCE